MQEAREVMLNEDFALIDHCLMVRMPGEIDHHSALFIREQTDVYLLNSEVENIVFDFERTYFMDSSGIGVIMGRYKKISIFGGRVYAIHTSERVKRIIQMSGLQKLMEVLS